MIIIEHEITHCPECNGFRKIWDTEMQLAVPCLACMPAKKSPPPPPKAVIKMDDRYTVWRYYGIPEDPLGGMSLGNDLNLVEATRIAVKAIEQCTDRDYGIMICNQHGEPVLVDAPMKTSKGKR